MTRLFIPARRIPAGVDQQFDDIESESRELIRLALGGHVFEASSIATPRDQERRSSKGAHGWPGQAGP
jgi:hypothetical protein